MSKKILVALAATAALALVGPAMASADTWYADSSQPAATALPSSGSYSDTIGVSGNLSLLAAGQSVTCPVTATVDIGNDTSGNAIQSVTDFQILASSGSPCGTSINSATCTVVGASTFTFPWSATDLGGSTIEIGGIRFTNTFDSTNCAPFNGATIAGGLLAGADGTLTAAFTESSQSVDFSSPGSGTISSSLGAAGASGSLAIVSGASAAYDIR